jgi:hypothetical protein
MLQENKRNEGLQGIKLVGKLLEKVVCVKEMVKKFITRMLLVKVLTLGSVREFYLRKLIGRYSQNVVNHEKEKGSR